MFDYREFIPKSFLCFKEGYNRSYFFNDLFAGISIGIISLPIVMAFAIASGVSPERGLYTGIVAGFLIALLGGSRVQISGPTGAFVVIIYSIVQRHGYEGLAIATFMAGIMIALMGLARLGSLLKYIPFPVITGFSAGIAAILATSQVKNYLGLTTGELPPEFLDKWMVYFQNLHTWNPWAVLLATSTLFSIILIRKYFPKLPAVLIAIVAIVFIKEFFQIPVNTIGTVFGEIPRMLPFPTLPDFTLEKIRLLFPDAISIALLGAIESLLSAVLAEGLTGTKHRPNSELLAQGLGNMGSIIFGGIPATGAIARTAANANFHAKSPLSGMIHAITLLLLMVVFAPWAAMIPLPALAAVLIFVAWNMSERHHIVDIFQSSLSDAAVFLITLLVTILIDITVAVQVGVVLAALIFLKKMASSTTVNVSSIKNNDEKDGSETIFRNDIPDHVMVFEIDGPLFFGVSDLLTEAYSRMDSSTEVFILRMHKVPMIDTTGMRSLKLLQQRCHKQGILFIISEIREDVYKRIVKAGLEKQIGKSNIFSSFDKALKHTGFVTPLTTPELTSAH
jgi:SulP family sulfate permease